MGDDSLDMVVADDHGLVREGLVLQISRFAPQARIREAGDYGTVLTLLAEAPTQAVLLDLVMPGAPDWQAGLTQVRAAAPASRLVVISAHTDRATIAAALALGADGYIPKASAGRVMVQALKLVLDGGRYLPPELLDGHDTPAPERPPPLTARQQGVLHLLAEGLSNKEIAGRLGVSEATVKLHVTAVLRATGASNRTQAVVLAASQGLL